MGLFFPVDPGAEEATIGGMASTRASGTTAVRYGTMRENVLNITAVLADGSTIKTAQRARKSAAGYDLTRLLVGSEGTLGIITELTVRLYGIPESILSAVCPFATLEGACNAVIQSIQLGLGVARMELLDAVADQGGQPVRQARARGEADAVSRVSRQRGRRARPGRDTSRRWPRTEGALRFDWAENEEDRRRLWKARHEVYWAIKSVWPGGCARDRRMRADLAARGMRGGDAEGHRGRGLIAPIVGHVGDGNFHTTPVFDLSNAKEMAALEGFLERLAQRAIAMEGTCTGEHGIGQGKMKYLKAELGEGLAVMRPSSSARPARHHEPRQNSSGLSDAATRRRGTPLTRRLLIPLGRLTVSSGRAGSRPPQITYGDALPVGRRYMKMPTPR